MFIQITVAGPSGIVVLTVALVDLVSAVYMAFVKQGDRLFYVVLVNYDFADVGESLRL